MKKFDAEKHFFTKWQLCELRHFSNLYELIHEKTCFLHIFMALCSDIIFFIEHYCAGGIK